MKSLPGAAALAPLAGMALALAGCGFALPASSVPAADAVDWHAEPIQGATWRTPFTWPTRRGSVRVRPRAAFDVSAVVAAAEPYSFDDGAFLSPVDLVLTWGRLPEEPYRSRVSYYQITRYYFWRTRDAGLDLRYIATHSANMHMIPSTRNLGRALAHVGGGERVRVRGLLVDVETARGFRWHTSLSRDDTGPGACELVWVEELQRGRRLYR
ncbi:MAG TPA: hypothetical protein VE075_08460 [Thermoanaerobaculia bacterium]|nr:hypothetical protein [Thermoanaerobaculia bacterium]